MRKIIPKTVVALFAGLLMATMSDMTQAFPGSATTTGNSCNTCHGSAAGGSDRPGALAVLGEGLLDLDAQRNDGSMKGAIPFFTVLPGDTISLTMDVLDGTDLYAVQIKRLEKAGILGPADTDYLTGYTPDGAWFAQGATDTYYTSVSFSTAWPVVNPSGPDPYSFDLTIDPNTPFNTYDLEYAVAGRLGDSSRLKFYGDQHFYVSVIPEPGTFALAGLGMLGICTGYMKRRR